MQGAFILIIHIASVLSACPYGSLFHIGLLSCDIPRCMVDSKICTDECPSLFIENVNNCPTCYNYCSGPSFDDAILFNLEFYCFQDLTLDRIQDSYGSGRYFLNPGGISYDDLSQNSPLPTVDRGFYFASTSGMTSGTSFIPGLYFILNSWIKILDSGEILNVQVSGIAYMRINSVLGSYMFSALINDSSGNQISVSEISASAYSTAWHYVSIYFNQENCDTGSLSFEVDGVLDYTATWTESELSFPSGTYTWTFGNTGSGDSFRGFIYWLQVRVDNDRSTYISIPPVDCAAKEYWDGSVCQVCDYACPSWPWCIRSSDCRVCYSPDCSSCSGYSLAGCSVCTVGILPFCCDHLATECTEIWTDTFCSVGVPNSGVCLYGNPYGSANCGGDKS